MPILLVVFGLILLGHPILAGWIAVVGGGLGVFGSVVQALADSK